MELTAEYWTERYNAGNTPWEVGSVTPTHKHIIDGLPDTSANILVPGGGRGHEWAYLHERGFANSWLLDWSEAAASAAKARYPLLPQEKIIIGDFFSHSGEYDVILEHTFFCAIDAARRPDYAKHMAILLKPGGKLTGLLFHFPFREAAGPPFGGSHQEYVRLFSPYFHIEALEPTPYATPGRKDNESLILFTRNSYQIV